MFSDTIPIPSCGYFYEGRPEYLKVFYLTTEDELNMTAVNTFAKGDVLNNLLIKKVCEPNNLKIEDLLLYDKEYILLFLKDIAYGYVLDYQSKDSTIYFDTQNVRISNIKQYPNEDLFYVYKFRGDTLKIKHLTVKDEKKVNKKSKLSFYIEQIISINDETDRKFINKYFQTLPILEAKKIKNYIDSISFGVDKKTFAIIDGKKTNIDLMIDESLFGFTLENLSKINKTINDSIAFLLNEGNGFSIESILNMPVHVRKFHEDKLIEKIEKINDSLKNKK